LRDLEGPAALKLRRRAADWTCDRHAVKKILIVDDSDTIRQQVRKALGDAGYELIEAADGTEGLARLRANTDCALALCDVNMPGMNGLDMLVHARRDGYPTPVVMLTTEGQPALVQRARAAGAKGWIMKPFKVEMLVAAVNKIVAR
jgi:two-component system chemotaxis response regulator CheY